MALTPINTIANDLLNGSPNIFTQELSALGILPPQWGIFDGDGAPVVIADTVLSFEYKKDWSVSDYSQEAGAFESYDKVELPGAARFTFMSGGSFTNRQQLLDTLDEIAGDLNLYDIVTPEKTYTSYNVDHFDYRRANGGAGFIIVTVWLVQIRENAEASLTTADPNGAPETNGGQVQPAEPTKPQQSVLSSWFGTQK